MSEIKPALTAEQKARDMLERMEIEGAQFFSAGELVELANLIHAVSGFTREDVRACRGDVNAYVEDRDEMLRSLADRIEALLPPEK